MDIFEKPTRNHSTVTMPIEAKFLAAAQLRQGRLKNGDGNPTQYSVRGWRARALS